MTSPTRETKYTSPSSVSLKLTKNPRISPGAVFSEYSYSTVGRKDCQVQSIGKLFQEAPLKSSKELVISEVNNTNTKTQAHLAQTLPQVKIIADKLAERLNNPSRLKFYYKVAWHLPESKIFVNLEIALTGHDPVRYFSFLCIQDMKQW